MSMKLEDTILQAIDIIANKRIANAGYDKTIQATIVSCVDATIGKYKVKYQDSILFAYSGNTDTTYSKGANVYVLVPGGNMNNDKTILGTTQKLGINYINISEEIDKYRPIGNSVIKDFGRLGICSYVEGERIKYSDSGNIFSSIVNKIAAKEYLSKAKYFAIKCDIQTDLDSQQKNKGDYGIIVKLKFKNNSGNGTVIRNYMLNIDQMAGDPYNFSAATSQYIIFSIDNQNFIDIQEISFFTKDFIEDVKTDQHDADIFFSNFEIQALQVIQEQNLNGYNLIVREPYGHAFFENDSNSKKIRFQGQVRVKNQVVDLNSQSIDFYWFIENATITTLSGNKYSKLYGGQGWQLIQKGSNVLELIKSNIITETTKYKCTVSYDGIIFSRQFEVKNFDAEYQLTITSSGGTVFYLDSGNPTLQCVCSKKQGSIINVLKYNWSYVDNVGIFRSITDNSTVFNIIDDGIGNKGVVDIKQITSFATFKCTVIQDQTDRYLGTATITLKNILEAQVSTYSMVINNATQVFKYNTLGISPASEQNIKPIEIPTLSFSVYSPDGVIIDSQTIRQNGSIKWKVPKNNTMLVISNSTPSNESTDEEYVFINQKELSYTIAKTFNINNSNNSIILEIQYDNVTLVQRTNFSFIKEGAAGTNGTDFICKIVPNVSNSTTIPMYPTAYYNGENTTINWLSEYSYPFFNVELWRNGDLIFRGRENGQTESQGRPIEINWAVEKNFYGKVGNTRVEDDTTYNKDASNEGLFVLKQEEFNSVDITNYHPANLIKATVQYDGFTHYGFIPIITVRLFNNNYKVDLKEGSGFIEVLYTNSGNIPSYDTHQPFTLIVKNNNNEDISLEDNITYEWYLQGSIKQQDSNSQWNSIYNVNKNWLRPLINQNEPLQKNQYRLKPAETYDGECINTGLACIIKNSGINIAWIHIPIHFLRNRYFNSVINGWDGNSVELGEDNGGMILAPQVGAGVKQEDNSFTGVFIGTSKDPAENLSSPSPLGSSNQDVGLFGYSHGKRSIFLDAKTGDASFGVSNGSQILIQPSSGEARIQSGNYGEEDEQGRKMGMKIDLSTPQIKFASGFFQVNKYGQVTATKGEISGDLLTDHIKDKITEGQNFDLDLNTGELKVKQLRITSQGGTGGRNLVLESETKDIVAVNDATINIISHNDTIENTLITNGIKVTGTSGPSDATFGRLYAGSSVQSEWLKCVPEVSYIHSIYIHNNGQLHSIIVNNNLGQSDTVGPGQTKRVVLYGIGKKTGNTPNGLRFNFSTDGPNTQFGFTYWHPQIEIGTIVSDWSVARQDMQQLIDSSHTWIENNKQLISTFQTTYQKQADTPIYNLIPSSYNFEFSKNAKVNEETGLIEYISNGITYTIKNDGSIEAKGNTANEENDSFFYITSSKENGTVPPIMLDPSRKYTLSGQAPNSSVDTYCLRAGLFTDFVNGDADNVTYYTSPATTNSGYKYAIIYIRIRKGLTDDINVIFHPQFEIGQVAHAYSNPRSGTGDSVSRIIQAQTNITQTSELIELTAKKTETKIPIINLVPNVYYTQMKENLEIGQSYIDGNVQFIIKEDGEIDVRTTDNTGIANKNAYFYFTNASNTGIPQIVIDPEKEYRLSGCPNQGNSIAYSLRARINKTDPTASTASAGTAWIYDYGKIYSQEDDADINPDDRPIINRANNNGYQYVHLAICITKDAVIPKNTGVPLKFKPQLEVGELKHTWSPPFINNGGASIQNSYSKIKQTADSIESTVATEFEKLNIGGRNLFRNSETTLAKSYQNSGTFNIELGQTVNEWGATDAIRVQGSGNANTIVATLYSGAGYAVKGQEYVHSIYIQNKSAYALIVNNNGLGGVSEQIASGQIKRVILKGKLSQDSTIDRYLSFNFSTKVAGNPFYFVYWHPKIEEGNVASAWSIAPQDLEKIDNLIPSLYYRENTDGSQYVSNGITWTVSQQNGSVQAKGIATDISRYSFTGTTTVASVPVIVLDPTKQYILSGTPSVVGEETPPFSCRIAGRFTPANETPSSTSGVLFVDNDGNGVKIPTGYKYAWIYAQVNNNTDITNGVRFYPQLEQGISKHAYQNPQVSISSRLISAESHILQQADKIGLVVTGTDNNYKVNRAAIIAAINDDNTTSTFIEANNIILEGSTLIEGLNNVVNNKISTLSKTNIPVYCRSTKSNREEIQKPGTSQTIYNTDNGVDTQSGSTTPRWYYCLPKPKGPGYFYYTCQQITDANNNRSYTQVRSLDSINYASSWALSSDSTQINGAYIATGTIDAGQINVLDLNAFNATIGKWKIDDYNIYKDDISVNINNQSKAMKIGMQSLPPQSASANTAAFYVKNVTDNTYPFLVRYNGKLEATNAEIEGTITATAGRIGGFNITSTGNSNTGSSGGGHFFVNSFYTHSNGTITDNDGVEKEVEYEAGLLGRAIGATGGASGVAFYVGQIDKDANWSSDNRTWNFYVRNDGYLYSRIGNIAGFTINDTSIRKGVLTSTASGAIALSTEDFTRIIDGVNRTLRFAIGNRFGVSSYGTLYATNAVISGNITATKLTIAENAVISGTISAGNIDTTNLHVKAANIDGRITASQIDATELNAASATVAGSVNANSITTNSLKIQNQDWLTWLNSYALSLASSNSKRMNIGQWQVYSTAAAGTGATLAFANTANASSGSVAFYPYGLPRTKYNTTSSVTCYMEIACPSLSYNLAITTSGVVQISK